MIVFPMDGACPVNQPCENNDWVNYVVGCGLTVVACVNIMGICKTRRINKATAKEEAKQKALAD